MRKVVITGGVGALGTGVASVFAKAGWDVIVTCLDATEAGRATVGRPVAVDLRDRAAVDAAAADLGDIDALVCCAGGFSMQALTDSSVDDYERLMDLNVRTAVSSLAGFGPHLRAGSGVVLVAARTWPGAAGVALYAASKAAVVSLGRSAALEWKPRGVRVNVIAPDIVDTPANRRAMPETDEPGRWERWARPDEIGAVVAWLCSPESRLLTGQALDVGR